MDYQDQKDYCAVVTQEAIAKKGFDLSPNQYVDYHQEAMKPYSEVKAKFLAAYENMKTKEMRFKELMQS